MPADRRHREQGHVLPLTARHETSAAGVPTDPADIHSRAATRGHRRTFRDEGGSGRHGSCDEQAGVAKRQAFSHDKYLFPRGQRIIWGNRHSSFAPRQTPAHHWASRVTRVVATCGSARARIALWMSMSMSMSNAASRSSTQATPVKTVRNARPGIARVRALLLRDPASTRNSVWVGSRRRRRRRRCRIERALLRPAVTGEPLVVFKLFMPRCTRVRTDAKA